MPAVTRRTALGGGVLAAGGAAAVLAGQTTRGRRWLHQIGLVEGPSLPVPDVDVRVDVETLRSRAMARDVRWRLYAPERPEALVVCLHGRNGDDTFAFDDIGVPAFIAASGRSWAAVSVDGGASSYWHERADGTDPQAMLFDELVPAVVGRVGQLPLLLFGWSMGGYGALLAASDRHDSVTAVAASSPALWRSFEQAARGAFDSAEDFAAHDIFRRVKALSDLPVRLDCGRDDPFVANVSSLADALPDAALDLGDGFHDEATWRSFVPHQLDFFEQALSTSHS